MDIREFYETFPYPDRDPSAPAPAPAVPSDFVAVNHYVFGGRWSRSVLFRVLVAGCGTGLASTAFAGQLVKLGVPFSMLCIDVSETSLGIARDRAERAGLSKTMEFQHRGIETLEAEVDGSFDYIDFTGVVNHVEDPAKILAFLSHVLAEPGGIGVMAYGRLGRTGIYPIQDALARLGLTTKDDIPAARVLLRTLPETNWFRQNTILADSDKISDVEFADRFFNPRDRAFSVRDLGQLFGGVGFELRAFLPPIVYDSRAILSGEDLRRRAGSLSRLEQWHLAEQLQGSLNKHTFYAIRSKGPSQGQIDYTEPDYRAVIQGLSRRHLASALQGLESKRISIAFDHDSRQRSMSLDLSVLEVEILSRLNDGDRFGEIRERFSRLKPLVVNAAIERVCRALTAVGVLHLEISPYRT